MKWTEIFTSSIGKKLVMALSGLFLISFLVIHVGLNACIWANDKGEMFNKAAHFMDTSVVVRILEVVLFAGFFVHIIQGIVLEIQNRSKRKIGYQIKLGNRGSKWNSRFMGLLGTIIFMFLIIHWKQLWIPSRFTGVAPVVIDGKEMQDMFSLMKVTFSELWVVIVYVVACYSLCWHLIHGFQSAFRTIGVYNNRYLIMINKAGIWFSVIVSLAFAMMPVSMYLNWV
ncbi:MAG: succinate dehydrogenase cytochrome b subunit [Chitinophagales bacterium]|nr:succinate dehydrogenase cytochrome b subunit [Chitinophagales bacterium]